jgi:glyceraldehyde 3-phosphate dehydrogenase
VTAKVAINGFGRIGRNVLRALAEHGRDDVQVVAINDLAPPATNAHLFRYDSVHGRFPGEAKLEGDTLHIRTAAGKTLAPIKVLAERDLAKLPWGELGVDIVLECTGIFTSKQTASGHLGAGAKKVLVSAPADGADLTVVFGVNQDQLRPEHTVVSNASCTTNCLAPVAKVLNDLVGIERGHMTTIHSFTNDQNLLDVFHKDLYRARAATASMIPTSTGAAKAVGLVLPELEGKLDGVAIRVHGRPDLRAQARHRCRRDRRGAQGCGSFGAAQGRARGDRGAAGLDRLQPQPGQFHGRPQGHQGARGQARARGIVVRQRVGLLEPDVRHRRTHGATLAPGPAHHTALALQLQGIFEVSLLRHGLMASSPGGPGDDERRLDPALR